MKVSAFFILFLICASFNKGLETTYLHSNNPQPAYYENKDLGKFFSDPEGITESITIPLKRAGKLIIIEAKVDSIVGNFIFDTGAPGLVLNKTYFRDAQKVYNSGEAGITGTSDNHYRKKVDRFSIGSLYFEKLLADVTELGHLENKKGVKILGLIGASFLKDFEAILDLRRSVLHLYLVDKKGEIISKKTHHFKFKEKFKLQFANNVICTKAEIGTKSISFCLDTGAESNVIDVSSDNEIIETISINKRVEVKGASSQAIEVFYGIMNDFSLDQLKLPKMNVLLTDLSNLRQVYGINIQGMLGNDFFEQGLISINIRKKELGIQFYKEEKQ